MGSSYKRVGAYTKNQQELGARKEASTGSYSMFFSSSTLYHRITCRRCYISTKQSALSKNLHDNKNGVVFL